MQPNHRIMHIMSSARSGETLLLRCLAQHPKLHIVHNLFERDTIQALDLFSCLKDWKGLDIAHDHEKVKAAGVSEGSTIILKQGTWEHKSPFKGLILIRNPLASYASLRSYDLSSKFPNKEQNWKTYGMERLLRWSHDIDPTLASAIEAESEPASQFALFFNRRFQGLKNGELGLPVFRYEDLCQAPEQTLQAICTVLDIDYTPAMAESHLAYKSGVMGHGKMDLSKAISSKSVDAYREKLSEKETQLLNKQLEWFMNKFNYSM